MSEYDGRWVFDSYDPPEELKYGVRYVEEILHEVAREEGMSKEEINDVWKHQKRYIRKLMEEDGVYSIDIPFVGALCFNIKYFDKFFGAKKKDPKFKDTAEKAKQIKEHENYTYYNNAHKRAPGIMRMARSVLRRFESSIKRRRLMFHTKCYPIIESFSRGEMTKRKGVR